MNINVTKNDVTISNEKLHKGEYNVNLLHFTFSQEYTSDLVKKVVFTPQLEEHYAVNIENNEAQIPYEVLTHRGNVLIGVYAYKVDGEELTLRYSPKPLYITIEDGSWVEAKDGTTYVPALTLEQYEQALHEVIEDSEHAVEEIVQDAKHDFDEHYDGKVTEFDNHVSDKFNELTGNFYTKTQTNNLLDEKQEKITSDNKLPSDKVTDVGQTNKFVTEAEKTTWNNKSDFSGDYNDLINKPTIPNKTSQLTNDSGYITNQVNNLVNYELKTDTGHSIELTIDTDFVMTLNLKNSAGTTISTDSIDLPLESVVVSGRYDSATKEVVLTLENGNIIRFSVADLVSGLQTEITSSNKLASDLVDDTNQTNKFVTSTDITNWNNKSDFSGSYNDLTNKPTIPSKTSQLTNDSEYITNTYLANRIKNNLTTTSTGFMLDAAQGKALNDNKEDKSNKVTSISSSSTDIEYPSAKLLYDKLALKQDNLTAGDGISILNNIISSTVKGISTVNNDNIWELDIGLYFFENVAYYNENDFISDTDYNWLFVDSLGYFIAFGATENIAIGYANQYSRRNFINIFIRKF